MVSAERIELHASQPPVLFKRRIYSPMTGTALKKWYSKRELNSHLRLEKTLSEPLDDWSIYAEQVLLNW